MAAAPLTPRRFENVNLLRAFAALAVIVYHVIEKAGWQAFPSSFPLVAFRVGWFGVDLFFVISGFVIAYSGILLRREDPPGFARAYWVRRLARILPLYLVTLFAWLAVFHTQFRGAGWPEMARQLAAHLTFTHSFWPSTHGSIDGVNWSLAIEMHFYVAMALLMAWIDRTPAWRIALYALLVSWSFRAAMFSLFAGAPNDVVFVRVTQLPGTLDEFAVGIVAAKWILERPDPAPRAALGWTFAAVATSLLAWELFWPRAGYWDDAFMVVFWRTLLAISFGCVLMVAARLPTTLARWLRPLDWMGEVSYGLYLWHLFAIVLAVRFFGAHGPLILSIALPATIAMAASSWYVFEKPLVRWARARHRAGRAWPRDASLELPAKARQPVQP